MSYEQDYAKIIAQVKKPSVVVPKARLWHMITERRQPKSLVFPRAVLVFTTLLIMLSGVFATQTYQANSFIEEISLPVISAGTLELGYVSDVLTE